MFVFNLFENTEQKPKAVLPVVKEDAWHNGQNSWSSEHDQWAKESVEEDRLSVGDPVVVTAPNEYKGKTGEISEFSPSGKFVIVNLYNHGEHSMHLSDVEYNKYADEVDEGAESDPVAGAITRRILMQRLDLLKQYGPELVGAAVDNVADYVGDVDEIGSSDVSAWVAQVERMLKDNPPEAFSEGQVSPDVSHRGDVDTKANIEVTGVDFDNDTFKITYNGKPYTVKIQYFSKEDLRRWQIPDYEIDVINSKGKNIIRPD
jgi:hypothetical protein